MGSIQCNILYSIFMQILFVESSQFGSSRPLSCCRVNNQNTSIPSSLLLTGCFGGELRLWNLDNSNQVHSWRGHSDRVCGVAWSPLSQLTLSTNQEIINQSHQVSFASASLDSFNLFYPYYSQKQLSYGDMRIINLFFFKLYQVMLVVSLILPSILQVFILSMFHNQVVIVVLLALIHHSVSGILRLVNNYSYKMVMLVRFMVLISNVMVVLLLLVMNRVLLVFGIYDQVVVFLL